MKVDVIISADYIREDLIKDKIVVVIDVLRATTVITTAIMNGCREVIPLLTVEEAISNKEQLKENCILGGERRAMKINGFDLSNSPREYTSAKVKDKTVILTTTNGTRTLTSSLAAKRILVGAMINGRAVARKLYEFNKDVVIINAGTNGQFSMDDFICTGFILRELKNIDVNLELSDISKAAMKVYDDYPNIIDYIKEAKHYDVMLSLDLKEDIEYCIQKNITEIVPEYKQKHIIGIS